MPHQCTNCGRTFPDGSKEMLSGCPDCGGNKFQFAPTASAMAANASGSPEDSTSKPADGSAATGPSRREPPTGAGEASADSTADSSTEDESKPDGVTARAAETVREWVSSESTAGNDASQANGADASWPSGARETAPADEDTGFPEADEDTGFPEWPESARRPDDRTSSSDRPDARADRTDARSDRADPGSSSTRASTGTAAEPSPGSGSARGEHDSSVEPPLENGENSAQADARSEMVPSDELPEQPIGTDDGDRGVGPDPGERATAPATDTPGPDGEEPPGDGRVVSEPSGDRPSIEELREELNEQFESIKIVRPGQYELNLMELYNRDEYIISLQEDGRYVIDVPDSWREADDD